jgi:hypothetical protein
VPNPAGSGTAVLVVSRRNELSPPMAIASVIRIVIAQLLLS